MRRNAGHGLLLLGLAVTSPAAAQSFTYTELTGAANPFDGIVTNDDTNPNRPNSAPTFVDIDNDGDLDLYLGAGDGTFTLYTNTGGTNFVLTAGAGNPLNGGDVGEDSKPTFLDIQLDGDPDLLVGNAAGDLILGLNQGTPGSPNFQGFNLGNFGAELAPATGDMDGDGDPDLFLGLGDGTVDYFENTSANNTGFTARAGAAHPLNGVDVGNNATVAIGDVDGDGDIDLVVGERNGNFNYFENVGSTPGNFNLVQRTGAANPFDAFDVGRGSVPYLIDLDGDGDLDMVSGAQDGTLHYYQHNAVVGGVGAFDAVEVGFAVASALYTKVAGVAFDVDILAVAGGLIDTGYRGDVDIYLIDARDNSGVLDANNCRNSWSLLAYLGQERFRNPDNGRVTLSGTIYADAVSEVRLGMIDGNGDYGCSSDAFAIRPDRFEVLATDATATTAGTARSLTQTGAAGTPTHNAGRPFTIQVRALNAGGAVTAGYDGSPSLTATGSVLGANLGGFAAGGITNTAGIARTDTATYSEAGAFTLEAADVAFTSIDNADGTPLAQRRIGPATLNVGRFTPDDFLVAFNSPQLDSACGAFSYIGQPLAWGLAPSASVTAINAGGGTTQNYAGSLFKLGVSAITNGLFLSNSGSLLDAQPLVTVTELGNGLADLLFDTAGGGLQLARPAAAQLPFDLELRLQADLIDGDGVAYSANPMAVGDTSAGNGIAFSATKTQHYGRLRLLNAYGSELLDLDVPVRVESFASLSGTGGWVSRSDDACTDGTAILPADITLDESLLGNGSAGQTTAGAVSIVGGAGRVPLSAPGATGRVLMNLDLSASYPWLRPDSDLDGNHADPATANASFGLYADDARRVYSRERIR